MEAEFAFNVLETASILRAAAAANVTFACFASTTQVYRAGPQPAPESGPVEPQNAYAVAKLAQEECFRYFGYRTMQPTAVLRLSTVYGPGELVNRAVPNFIRAVLAGRRPVLDGTGDQPFDLVYVDDVARAFIRATATRISSTVNIASGRLYTAREVAERVIVLCGSNLSFTEDRQRTGRAGASCDTRRAARLLNFTATTGLDFGLTAEIEWLRQWDRQTSGARSLAVAP
jgi:nucleoside-diphosphate-sugar epimerase